MKKDYKFILWDIDDTLVDFKASEKVALKKCFEAQNVSLSDEDIEVYSKINYDYWKLLEKGEIEKSIMLNKRFDDFIKYLSVEDIDSSTINKNYQLCLGDYTVMYENAFEICSSLKGVKKQYAITNGTALAQQRKLKNTGLDKIFDDIFISDLIGYQKPDVRFFEYVAQKIPNFNPKQALVIGDSLTGDIKGANNAGIDCCWANLKSESNCDESLKVNFEIKTLKEVLDIIIAN